MDCLYGGTVWIDTSQVVSKRQQLAVAMIRINLYLPGRINTRGWLSGLFDVVS